MLCCLVTFWTKTTRQARCRSMFSLQSLPVLLPCSLASEEVEGEKGIWCQSLISFFLTFTPSSSLLFFFPFNSRDKWMLEWRCSAGEGSKSSFGLNTYWFCTSETHTPCEFDQLTVSFHVPLNIARRIFFFFIISGVGQGYNIWPDEGNELKSFQKLANTPLSVRLINWLVQLHTAVLNYPLCRASSATFRHWGAASRVSQAADWHQLRQRHGGRFTQSAHSATRFWLTGQSLVVSCGDPSLTCAGRGHMVQDGALSCKEYIKTSSFSLSPKAQLRLLPRGATQTAWQQRPRPLIENNKLILRSEWPFLFFIFSLRVGVN